MAEEHGEQITLKNKRLEAQEAYIHELRTRITKYAQGEGELEVSILHDTVAPPTDIASFYTDSRKITGNAIEVAEHDRGRGS